MRWMIPALLAAAMLCFVGQAMSQVRVKGYFKKGGTYVAPHVRSSPNSSPHDNYSTKGNYNPYTGEKGTVDPYREAYRYLLPTLPASHAPVFPAIAPSSNGAVERANVQLGILANRLRVEDPYFSVRGPVLAPKIDQMMASTSPENWVGEVERMYWEIPAGKEGIGQLVETDSSAQVMLPIYICRSADSLYYSGSNSGGCTYLGTLPAPSSLP